MMQIAARTKEAHCPSKSIRRRNLTSGQLTMQDRLIGRRVQSFAKRLVIQHLASKSEKRVMMAVRALKRKRNLIIIIKQDKHSPTYNFSPPSRKKTGYLLKEDKVSLAIIK